MTHKLVPSGLRAGGLKSIKLADMRGAELDIEHKAWLDQMIAQASMLTDVEIYIIGFGSTSGSEKVNMNVSKERAYAVRDYIKARSDWLANRVTRFDYKGEGTAEEFGRNLKTETDPDDHRWRAVEVHLLGKLKPAPRAEEDPDPPSRLPGASVNWAMSSVGAINVTIPGLGSPGGAGMGGPRGAPGTGIASVGVALFIFQKLDLDKGAGLYISFPVGVSLSLSTLLRWLKVREPSKDPFELQMIQAIIKALVGGGFKGLMNLSVPKPVKVENPFRYKDLETAGIAVAEALVAKFVEVSGKLPTFNNHGRIVSFPTKTFFRNFKLEVPTITPSGDLKDFDISLGKFTGGGLTRIAWMAA